MINTPAYSYKMDFPYGTAVAASAHVMAQPPSSNSGNVDSIQTSATLPISSSAASKSSSVPCRFFSAGKCSLGARCGFSHIIPDSTKKLNSHLFDASEAQNTPSICKYFQAGHCKFGTSCSMRHEQMSTLPNFNNSINLTASPKYLSSEPNFAFEYTEAPSNRANGRNSLLPSFLVDELFLDDADDSTHIGHAELMHVHPATAAKPITVDFKIPSPVSSLSFGAQTKSSSLPTSANGPSFGQTVLLNSESPQSIAQFKTSQPPSSLPPEPSAPLSPPTMSIGNSSELCAFSIMGKCRYGDYCRNVHGLQCPRCLMYVLHPTDMARNEEHIYQCFERPASLPIAELQQIECGVCRQPVLQKIDPRFGLLNCSHAFCLSCIRAWRSTHFDANNENPRSCPECREVTYFIVPSSTWIEDPLEKVKVIDQYKRKMSVIPCKYFEFGGDCPFGSSCFYEHKCDPSADPRPSPFFNPPPAHVIEHSERLAKVRESKLSDYIVFKTVPSLNKKK